MYLPYDSEELSRLLDYGMGMLEGMKDQVKVPPDRYVSELGHDVFTESAYVIDDILALIRGESLGHEDASRAEIGPRDRIFVSYSHADEARFRDVLRMLSPAIRKKAATAAR